MQRRARALQIVEPVVDQREVVMKRAERRLQFRRGFIVELRQLQITRIEIKVRQIVMSLDVTRIVLQRKRETVERLRRTRVIEFDDAEVAIGVREIVSL